ncbi:hypothetical protein DERP_008321 [Dermatophagoides pteronyssinus]|uniref:Serine/threonine-protein kinase DDB_G0282963 n=1 Tax=Dermatophagoides pteronyssinus TaxID=6956 RepID=A0ABQ8J658_DERPT|nr:hypothetical protein DERP_008321 [Dermatophagoides pteronyssinus]
MDFIEKNNNNNNNNNNNKRFAQKFWQQNSNQSTNSMNTRNTLPINLTSTITTTANDSNHSLGCSTSGYQSTSSGISLSNQDDHRYLTYGTSQQLQQEYGKFLPWPTLTEFRLRRKLRRFKRRARKLFNNSNNLLQNRLQNVKRLIKMTKLDRKSDSDNNLDNDDDDDNDNDAIQTATISRSSSLTSLLNLIEEANKNLINSFHEEDMRNRLFNSQQFMLSTTTTTTTENENQQPPKCPPRLKRTMSSINVGVGQLKSIEQQQQIDSSNHRLSSSNQSTKQKTLPTTTTTSMNWTGNRNLTDNYRIAFVENKNNLQIKNSTKQQLKNSNNDDLDTISVKSLESYFGQSSLNDQNQQNQQQQQQEDSIKKQQQEQRNSKILCVRSHFQINNGTIYLEDSDWEMCSEISSEPLSLNESIINTTTNNNDIDMDTNLIDLTLKTSIISNDDKIIMKKNNENELDNNNVSMNIDLNDTNNDVGDDKSTKPIIPPKPKLIDSSSELKNDLNKKLPIESKSIEIKSSDKEILDSTNDNEITKQSKISEENQQVLNKNSIQKSITKPKTIIRSESKTTTTTTPVKKPGESKYHQNCKHSSHSSPLLMTTTKSNSILQKSNNEKRRIKPKAPLPPPSIVSKSNHVNGNKKQIPTKNVKNIGEKIEETIRKVHETNLEKNSKQSLKASTTKTTAKITKESTRMKLTKKNVKKSDEKSISNEIPDKINEIIVSTDIKDHADLNGNFVNKIILNENNCLEQSVDQTMTLQSQKNDNDIDESVNVDSVTTQPENVAVIIVGGGGGGEDKQTINKPEHRTVLQLNSNFHQSKFTFLQSLRYQLEKKRNKLLIERYHRNNRYEQEKQHFQQQSTLSLTTLIEDQELDNNYNQTQTLPSLQSSLSLNSNSKTMVTLANTSKIEIKSIDDQQQKKTKQSMMNSSNSKNKSGTLRRLLSSLSSSSKNVDNRKSIKDRKNYAENFPKISEKDRKKFLSTTNISQPYPIGIESIFSSTTGLSKIHRQHNNSNKIFSKITIMMIFIVNNFI